MEHLPLLLWIIGHQSDCRSVQNRISTGITTDQLRVVKLTERGSLGNTGIVVMLIFDRKNRLLGNLISLTELGAV